MFFAGVYWLVSDASSLAWTEAIPWASGHVAMAKYGSLGCRIRSKMRWRYKYSFQNFHVLRALVRPSVRPSVRACVASVRLSVRRYLAPSVGNDSAFRRRRSDLCRVYGLVSIVRRRDDIASNS